jgi:hypothetical protein
VGSVFSRVDQVALIFVSQGLFIDFACRREWNGRDDDGVRAPPSHYPRLKEFPHLIGCNGTFRVRLNNQNRSLLPFWMIRANYGRNPNPRTGHSYILKINGTDPFSARLDDILLPISNPHKPVIVQGRYVARVEPSGGIHG